MGIKVEDPVALEEFGNCLPANKVLDCEGRDLDSLDRMGLDMILDPGGSLTSGLDMEVKGVDR